MNRKTNERQTGATLFRRNGPAWRFEWGGQQFVHRTTRGTTYAIFGVNQYKPMWIGRLKSGTSSWFTADIDIGAEYIQFDGGTDVWFRRPSE